MTKEIIANVESQWIARANTQNLKKGTKKYQLAEADFFTGAMAGWVAQAQENKELTEEQIKEAQQSAMIPKWIFGIMRGDAINGI